MPKSILVDSSNKLQQFFYPRKILVLVCIIWINSEDRTLPSRDERSGLSYFTIQIQSWILKTPSKSNHVPKIFQNTNLNPNEIQKLTKNRFFITKTLQFFSNNWVQIKSWSKVFETILSLDPIQIPKKQIVRIQSNAHRCCPMSAQQRWSESHFSNSEKIWNINSGSC